MASASASAAAPLEGGAAAGAAAGAPTPTTIYGIKLPACLPPAARAHHDSFARVMEYWVNNDEMFELNSAKLKEFEDKNRRDDGTVNYVGAILDYIDWYLANHRDLNKGVGEYAHFRGFILAAVLKRVLIAELHTMVDDHDASDADGTAKAFYLLLYNGPLPLLAEELAIRLRCCVIAARPKPSNRPLSEHEVNAWLDKTGY